MNTKTIIVIDTDKETLKKVMSTLESEGYLVFAASSKDVSITTANKVKPSLIFINIGMIGISGLEICKAIHGTETLENVPIVIITPHGGTIDPRYTSLYGIVDSLKKPFTVEELISKTKNAIAMESIEQPIQERATVQPVEEEIDAQLFEEGGIAEDAEKEFEVQPVEEVNVRPVEEEIDAHLFEEQIEIGKGEYETAIEETSDIQKEETKEIVLKESDVRQMGEDIEEGKKEQIAIGEPGESDSQMHANPYKSGKSKIRGSKRNRLFVPFVVLVLMVIVVGGIVLYRGMRQETEIQTPIIVTPMPPPVQQQATEVEPTREQQKSQQAVDESKPKPPPVAETKPEDKPIYSVQIGVFKNKANALAFVKKYKERGYDAFTYKSITRDKRILYRVLISNFDNKKEASKLANSIRSKEKINAIIFHK